MYLFGISTNALLIIFAPIILIAILLFIAFIYYTHRKFNSIEKYINHVSKMPNTYSDIDKKLFENNNKSLEIILKIVYEIIINKNRGSKK